MPCRSEAQPRWYEPASKHLDINPTTLAVVCEGLRAIVKEMRATTIQGT